MSAAAQHEIGALLETAGARPRGNRHDCPKCGGLRTVTHTEECFYCHRCGWKGNAVTLARELGIYERIPSADCRELCRNRERAREASERLYAAVKGRRLELLDSLRTLNRLESLAHDAGADKPETWDLVLVYADRPDVLAELAVLENWAAAALIRFFSADPQARERGIDGVLMRGGLCDSHGRFVELEGL